MFVDYDRQERLDVRIPDEVAIIGVGGIGSWASLFFALAGVRRIYLSDPDVVEESNRARTPFMPRHVGKNKAEAMAEVIALFRPETEVIIVNDDELREIVKKRGVIVVDTRDVAENIEGIKPLVKGGYDGDSITIDLHPDYGKVWSADPHRGYRIVPSYVVPASVVGALVVDVVLRRHIYKEKGTTTFRVQDMLKPLKEVVEDGEEEEEEAE